MVERKEEQTKSSFTITTDEGEAFTLNLTPDQADSLGLALVSWAAKKREPDDRPIQEQPSMMEVNAPEVMLFAGKEPDGTQTIAIIYKADRYRPVWLWYVAEQAAELARNILMLSANKDAPAN